MATDWSALKPLEIGLCSWCLHHTREKELRQAMEGFKLRAMQLALAPIAHLEPAERRLVVEEFKNSPLILTCGMVAYHGEDYTTRETIHQTGGLVPDDTFEERYALTIACGEVARDIGLKRISTHVGFIPPSIEKTAFDKIRHRLGQVCDDYAKFGISLLFETGQETADTLVTFLKALNRPNAGVNFDPANMLSYGKGDPVAAIKVLAPYIQHVHAKDSKRVVPLPVEEEKWRGRETPLGTGNVNLVGVIQALKEIGYKGPLIIEREAGTERAADIRTGIAFLQKNT
ncbi:MAG: sugar phosphate isomerase/epimerase [Phycisphaerales bacterium]|nr:sugar phosphate isomerase/epimerase [Phycisphaerales bacterium]